MMKLKISAIIISLFSVFAHAQKSGKTNTQNQNIEAHFKKAYKKKNYKKFEGKITVREQLVQFDNKVILYDKNDKITAAVLKNALIYPQLLTDFQLKKFLDETEDKTQKRFLKLQKDPRASFDVNNIKLSNTAVIENLSTNAQKKRFKTTYKDPRLNVSALYLFELTNDNASKQTALEDFIKNSKLTYLNRL